MTELPKGELRIDPLKLKSRQFINRSLPSHEPEKSKSSDQLRAESSQEGFIREYNKQYRSESLAEIYKREHAGKAKAEEKDDYDTRKFDWERDMNRGVKGGSAKDTAEMLSKFGNITSRFSSGTSSKRFL